MASVGISSRGGQLGGGRAGATTQIYYCFDCDRTFSITAPSDTGVICPICGHVVLEEFVTPSSSPPPLPSPPRPRSITLIDPQSFFPSSDTDSDIELSDPLPPPPPPPPSLSPHDAWNYFSPFDREIRHLRSPSRRPSLSVSDRRPPCPQLPVPLDPSTDYLFLSPPEENDTTQYSDSELDALQPPPLPPPPPPSEHLLRPSPLTPSSSRDVWEAWESFFPSFTESESGSEDISNEHMTSFIQPPPPPPPAPLPRTPSSLVFDHISDPELNSSNRQRASRLQLQPPPPPPWLQSLPTEGLLDMKMTEKLVLEWECHQCPICIDNFELNQMVKLMPCKHCYHSACILRWLDLHRSCPVCRYELPSL